MDTVCTRSKNFRGLSNPGGLGGWLVDFVRLDRELVF
jgi:hypothetical protein